MADVNEQLRKKIESKMEVAKFFAGFISILAGLAFDKISENVSSTSHSVYVPTVIGFFCILSSLSFSVAAMYAYDRLLMPMEFWEKKPKDNNLNDILHREMIKAWIWLFRPAVYSFFASLLCFLIPLVKNWYIVIGLWLVPILIILIYHNYSRIGQDIHS